MISRAQVIAAAREWLGVPFRHQGRTRLGCDCAGFVGSVASSLGLIPSEWWEPYDGYPRMPDGSIQPILDSLMTRTDEPRPGDVLLMRFRRDPQHLGFFTPGLLHALRAGAVRSVVEHRLDDRWRSRIVQAYRLPGVA